MKISTLKKEISCEGQGLHTGAPSSVTFVPSSHGGICFIKEGITIPVNLQHVVGTDRGVSLALGQTEIKTVEHLLAAIRWLGILNLEIHIQGNEIPIFDGSAQPWVQILKPHLEKTEEEFPSKIISNPFTITEGKGSIQVFPNETLSITYTIDYPNTPIGKQTWSGDISPDVFEEKLAPARTFGLLDEVKSLWERGLAKGGNSENCVVITKDAFLAPLRFMDEPVRHKVLDLTGDLALLGWIPQVKLVVQRGGHRLHTLLVDAFSKQVCSPTRG